MAILMFLALSVGDCHQRILFYSCDSSIYLQERLKTIRKVYCIWGASSLTSFTCEIHAVTVYMIGAGVAVKQYAILFPFAY